LGLIARVVRSAEIALVARATDHDFLFIDTQHAPYDPETIAALIAACRGAGIAPLVRLKSYSDPDASLYLDMGAGGLIIPDVNTSEQARALVNRCRFPPSGQRSLPGPLVQDDFRAVPATEAMQNADRETVLVAMIETLEGLENVESIAAVDGLDVLHVGCVDLLLSLGKPGEQGCPEILAAIHRVADAARRHGRILGIGGDRDPARRAAFIRQGAGFMTTDLDITILMTGAAAAVSAIRTLDPA
jgi:2-keto-3-deoxy-L-rhamnonate aldolase RhmA